jgi:putative PEP-CTERM system integral membrane protein
MNVEIEKKNRLDFWAYVLFWSWNVIFLSFMVFGFAPRLLPEVMFAIRGGTLPVRYLMYAVLLSSIPLVAVILGITRLRRAPAQLLALGYVVEGPLMLLLAIRFFVIRQATPGLQFLLAIAILGMLAFLWRLLDRHSEPRGRLLSWIRLAGLTLMALTSLYAALWIAFYALPLSKLGLDGFVTILKDFPAFLRNIWHSIQNLVQSGLSWIPFTVLGFILALYTATLFVLAPLAFPWLSLRAWWRELKALAGRHGWLLPSMSVILVTVVSATLFVLANRQPQRQAFELLSNPPATIQEAEALLEQKESIRAGLLNAYLSSFRYISAQGEVRHISNIYRDVFYLDHKQAFAVQRIYEGVALPLIYEPVNPPATIFIEDNRAFSEEPRQAAQLYLSFFDQPITEGERPALVNAARSTWSSGQAEAAWQAVDDREVHLLRQEVTVSEHGDWAEIEIFEVYQNRTDRNQEVIYYFNLPESTVFTGLWLGNSPDRDQAFDYRVAPRGAAQGVYREQTRRNLDPALLEQIGPRQYRLRIFPVTPMRFAFDANMGREQISEGDPLYLWATYRTLAADDAWPLPRLAYKQNVFWDNATERLVNGEPWDARFEGWLPEGVLASAAIQPAPHRVDLPGGESILALPASQLEPPQLPADLRLAVVLDRSLSMEAYAGEVLQAFNDLQAAFPTSVDVYLTASEFRGEPPQVVSIADFDPQGIVYFGGQNPAELLQQFNQLSAAKDYSAVLVLSDGGAYELGVSDARPQIPAAPLWMVHLGSDIPLGYDDITLQAIQASGGGVTGSLEDALTRIAFSFAENNLPDSEFSATRDLVDGYLWALLPSDQADNIAPGLAVAPVQDGFNALAARRLVLAEMQRNRAMLDELPVLDRIHALAVENSIVTPYSSMIVLVLPEQHRLLDQLEQSGDRFEREFEELGETTPATPTPLVGVPEPHEWLLISLAAAMLVYYAWTKRSRMVGI